MQAAYALTRLILFGFGWSVASILALAADELLPGMKWPIFGILAASWTFLCALYVVGEANRIGAASSTLPLPEEMSTRSFERRTGHESSSLRAANGSDLWPAR
jgi:hypothetical protein